MIKIVLAGLGMYGGFHLNYFTKTNKNPNYQLVAVIDPYASSSKLYDTLLELKMPIYADLTACLEEVKPDMAILCTPIDCHKPQILDCFAHGVHVLCEKPLAATLGDIEEIRAARDTTGLKLGVGFQWSFCDTIRALKDDIRSGVLGRPLHLKTFVSWQRDYTYYSSTNWKGRLNNASGAPVHDSILSNATAHYLHNMFFILDDAPASYEVLTARANPIETFDTAFMHGTFRKGGEFTYVVSHSAEINSNPEFTYIFENATVTFDSNREDMIRAVFRDGTVREYGPVSTPEQMGQKNLYMAQCVEQDTPVRCSVEEVLPFSTVCEEVFAHPEKFQVFPPDQVRYTGTMYQMPGLYEILVNCYQDGRMPTDAEKQTLGLV